LPYAGTAVLLAMAHRLKWDIYINESGERVALSDAQEAIIDETIEGLLMPCTIPDTSDALKEIAAAIAQLEIVQSNSQTVNCGTGGSFICYGDDGSIIINPGPLPTEPVENPEVEPPPGGWPAPIEPGQGEPPPGYDDWEEFDAAMCKASNAAVDVYINMLKRLRQFFAFDSYALAVIVVFVANILWSGLAIIFTRAMKIKVATILWRLSEYLEVFETALELTIAWAESNKKELVCLVYSLRGNMRSWDHEIVARVAGGAAVGSVVLGETTMLSVLQWLFPGGTIIRAFQLGILHAENYQGSINCAECEDSPPDAPDNWQWILVPESLITIIPSTTGNGQILQNGRHALDGEGMTPFANGHSCEFRYNVTSLLDNVGGITAAAMCARIMRMDPAPEGGGKVSFIDAPGGSDSFYYNDLESDPCYMFRQDYGNLGQAFQDYVDAIPTEVRGTWGVGALEDQTTHRQACTGTVMRYADGPPQQGYMEWRLWVLVGF
jgi:hypothetical protein